MTIMIEQTARIVAAYVRNHRIGVEEVALLVATVRRSLETLGAPAAPPHADRTPAVPIRRLVTPDHIVCLEDGRKLKMLKRYPRTVHGMTPEEYRARWNLPDTYPMTAPTYAATRFALAKARGLVGLLRPALDGLGVGKRGAHNDIAVQLADGDRGILVAGDAAVEVGEPAGRHPGHHDAATGAGGILQAASDEEEEAAGHPPPDERAEEQPLAGPGRLEILPVRHAEAAQPLLGGGEHGPRYASFAIKAVRSASTPRMKSHG